MRRLLAGIVLVLPVLFTASCNSTHLVGHSDSHELEEEPHHLSFLIGNTLPDDEGTARTIGVDYEYRVSELIGVGSVIEYAGEDLDAITLLAVADVHITPQFIVQVGPGIEFVDSGQEAVFRLGVLYEFVMEGYTVSPQLHRDWTAGEDSIVLALAIGWGF